MTYDPAKYAEIVKARKVALGTLLTYLHDGDLVAKTPAPTDDPHYDEYLKMVLLNLPNKRLVMLNREGPDVLSGHGSRFVNYLYDVWDGRQVLDLDENSPFYEILKPAVGKKYEQWPKAMRSQFWNYEVAVIIVFADDVEDDVELKQLLAIYAMP